MTTLLARTLLLAAFLVAASPLPAGMPMDVKIKCPVGGKTFTHTTTATMSQWGSRPDGKPYGSWTFPMPLAECPDNGLVMYRDFSKDEVKALKVLLATPGYVELRRADTPYYRAYWLMGQLHDPLDGRLWVLLQASWESDDNPALKERYQREYVELAKGYARPGAGQDDLAWTVLQLRAVNELRELGRHDEALALLDSIPLTSFDVVVPAEKVSGTTASGNGRFIENSAEIRAAESRRSWLEYAKDLRTVAARHDASSEPIDMLPVRVAVQMCKEHPETTPEYKQVCESEAVRKRLENTH